MLLLYNLERVEVGDFFYFLAGEQAGGFQPGKQAARGVALGVGNDALLAAGGVDIEREAAVEPRAAAALPGIATAADGGMVKAVELRVLDV